MSVVKTQMAVGKSALTQLGHTHVAVTLAIGLPLMDTNAMVHNVYHSNWLIISC